MSYKYNNVLEILPCAPLDKLSYVSLPLMVSTVSAGFPSPAEGSIDKVLDLNELLIRQPTSTFFVRVKGDSMRDAGILDGDLIVVERGERPNNRDIVLAIVEGEFTIKRWMKQGGRLILQAENPSYPSIHLSEHMDWEIWGVVRYAIHSCTGRPVDEG